MNWKLIFSLSLLGLAMAFATVWFVPSNLEPFFWLVIFIACAYLVARRAPNRFFWHGFLVSIVNSVWITAVHILFFSAYIANHPQEAAMMTSMPLPNSPRLMMAITGPIVGVISGLILGLFSWVASKLVSQSK